MRISDWSSDVCSSDLEAADDVGPVGVAVFERHQHLLADARRHEAAPLGAGVALGDAHPARTLVVVLALSVPVELHLHPSVVVDVDLVAPRSGHDRGLHAGHVRPWRTPGLAILHAAWDAGEAVAVAARRSEERRVGKECGD